MFLSGRPLWVNPELNASDAFVAAFLPGAEGGGIADVLFKAPDGTVAHDFHGKLSFSWPRTPLQTGISPGARPLFPYGYGLRYASDGNLKPLPEDPGTAAPTQLDTKVYFAAGRPGSGWSWIAGTQEVAGGVGMAANGALRLAATDHAAQEDARRISWGGTGELNVGLAAHAPIDLQREANGQLSLGFDYRLDAAPTAAVDVSMQCGPGCRGAVSLTHELAGARVGQWRHVKVLLSCFAKGGANMGRISSPFGVSTSGQLEMSVANVRLETGTDGLLSCGS